MNKFIETFCILCIKKRFLTINNELNFVMKTIIQKIVLAAGILLLAAAIAGADEVDGHAATSRPRWERMIETRSAVRPERSNSSSASSRVRPTIWMAGGGIQPGFSYGETDEYGYNIARDGVHIHDFQATLLHLLGIDHERLTYRHQGRRYRLTDVHGHVVKPCLA